MPKLSVIVPVYGADKYIERCARSLFGQTLDEIEYLFIDDCTPDRSIEILKRVLDDYPFRKSQVIIHQMEKNSGPAAVRKWGIQHSTGEYIIHCDSDDWVDSDMYRIMYEKARSETADVVVCDYIITDGDITLRTIRGCVSTEQDTMIERLLLQIDPWSLCNKMFSRDLYFKEGLIYPKGNMGEDMVLTFQMLLNASRVAYIRLPLYYYYFNPSSITHALSEERMMDNFWQNKENADIVYSIIEKKKLLERYNLAVVSNKWYIKKYLWSTAFDEEKRKLWKGVYKEINNRILINKYVTLKDKIKFILTYLYLFPKR